MIVSSSPCGVGVKRDVSLQLKSYSFDGAVLIFLVGVSNRLVVPNFLVGVSNRPVVLICGAVESLKGSSISELDIYILVNSS